MRFFSRLLGALLVLGAALAVVWVALWFWGPTGSRPGWVALAVTPVAVLGAALVAVVALVTRRWAVGGVALVATVVLAAVVVPRAVPDDPALTAPGRPSLTVATTNLQFGRADPAGVVALVRDRHVDVLGLQELTPEAEARLAAAGLFTALPFRDIQARPGAGGTGIASRHPLSPSGIALRPGLFAQVTDRVAAPGGPLDVVVTHPAAPVFRDDPDGWTCEITGLPAPAAPTDVPRAVIGDLNGTLDHRPVRALLARGHRDVAEVLGDGLVGTWPTDRSLPPFAVIDHVLVSGPVEPQDASVRELAGTDHATLTTVLVTTTP